MTATSPEPLLPIQPGAGPVTHVRSTWLTSSITALRDRGYFDRYAALLPKEAREQILTQIAGTWLPVSIAVTHYDACERLGLTAMEQIAIGKAVEDVARKTMLGMLVNIARGAGVTPWTAFAQQQRMWERAWRGGSVGVSKLGPKEALIEVVGWPCARFMYCRNALRGILLAQTGLLARAVFVNEQRVKRPDALAYRVAWA
jgi:hypothetical protein